MQKGDKYASVTGEIFEVVEIEDDGITVSTNKGKRKMNSQAVAMFTHLFRKVT